MPREPYYLVPLPTKVIQVPDPDNPEMMIDKIVSVLSTTEQNLGWDNPGRTTLRSPYTGDETIISRGVGRLVGRISIGEVTDLLDASIIEAWISTLSAQPFAICDLPIHRPTVEEDYSRTVSSTTSVSGVIRTILTSNHDDGLRVGHFVRSNFRVFMVTQIINSTTVVLTPQIALEVGDTIEPAIYARVKMNVEGSRSNFMRRTPHWYGPWSFDWIEVPISTEEAT